MRRVRLVMAHGLWWACYAVALILTALVGGVIVLTTLAWDGPRLAWQAIKELAGKV